MNTNSKKLNAIPTNVITGFLGVGKTSAILHLLKQKPSHERWAILVNEFGEIGVDGSLLGGNSLASQNVFIKEVPGGCMCCASGLPMQIALNLLLNQAKPDRLLIEPTGLGHPVEVLQLLSNQYYREVLSLEKTLTLVDARKLEDARYTEHETFNQQLAIADIIIGNKTDLYTFEDKDNLTHYIKANKFSAENLFFTEHGQVPFGWLLGKTRFDGKLVHHRHHNDKAAKLASEQVIPKTGFIKAENSGEGFHSIGWRFAPDQIFDRAKLVPWLLSINAIRVKATFITSDGIFGYNNTEDGLTEIALDECSESRIEIICEKIEAAWQSQLQQTVCK